MGAAYFYHLTRRPLEVTLTSLAGKARGAGWRVAVRAQSEAMMDRLDDLLWLRPEDGFLPHGKAGGAHDADQPVLLTTRTALPNGATCLISVEGAAISAGEVDSLDRVCVLFDGHDPGAVQQAREQWKTLTTAGCAAQYWSEEGGSWQMKAQSPSPE
ncbi:DNA polymerase III subunit chi [Rhodophyticola sp. CCM32]|uniref:DNA polymerase III subunit chi n=1 Tax=Rhodophyticola sp. CCM32 TaxID=2916397 RepID=UPI00107EF1BF|nr:DNA polymerase III subunit chi [Rhodophyticola sp. CCM32]QBX99980.1 DNA polymerase III subunit chi [Rhodophyticola sp. CCM32]